MTITLAKDAYAARLRELREHTEDHVPVREFVHEDGSHTFIVYDFDAEHANPRDDDENLARLVLDDYSRRNWRGLDDPDPGIAEAVNHFAGYGRYRTTAPTWGVGSKSRRDSEYMIRRYLSIFRPDVAHYDEWQVNGSTQSNWQGGYGYVMVEDFIPGRQGGLLPHERAAAKIAFDAEVKLYGQYFAGEVYGGYHVRRGAEIVTFGEQGAYVDGYEADEDAVWGFLGYNEPKEIAAEFTDSPIVEEVWL